MAIKKISANLLGNNAVTAASIAGGAISAADIADNSIGITQLNVSDGTNGQYLQTNGSGTLSFSTVSGYTDSDVETYLDGGTSTPTFATATISGDLTVDTDTFYVDSTNNRIGIGQGDSAYLGATLHIEASQPVIRLQDSDSSAIISYATVEAFADGTLELKTSHDDSTGDIKLTVNGNNALFVESPSGNVGIGTSSPMVDLNIHDTSTPRVALTNSTTGQTFPAGFELLVSGSDAYVSQRENANLIFSTNNIERLTIGNLGDMHLGQSDGDVKFYIGSQGGGFGGNASHNIRASGSSLLFNAGGASGLYAFEINGTEAMRIQKDINGSHVSIGTTNLQGTNGEIAVTLKLSSDTSGLDSALILEADNGEFTLYSYNNKFHIAETKTSGTFKYLATWDNNGNMVTGGNAVTTPLATFHVDMGDNPSGSDEGAVMRAVATNASFGNSNAMLGLNCARSGDSGYRFIQCNSNTTTSVTDAEFVLYGNGNANADGSWSGSGADYAEFFESTDGTAIPRGTSIVIENGKVRAATSEDDVSNIMGVARPKEEGRNSMIIGNTAWNFWTNKYLQDDFGCYIMEEFTTTYWVDEDTVHHEYATDYIPEDVVVPEDAQIRTHEDSGKVLTRRKLNPAWSESDVYVPRLERDEWIIVGLMGQVQILKGQPVNDRWIKMRDISDTVEEWYIR